MKLNYEIIDLVDVCRTGKCVAFATTADFAMGSGVAKTINKEFQVKDCFKSKYDKVYPDAGETYMINTIMDNQHIFALIDKRNRYDAVDIDNLKKCFICLRQLMVTNDIYELYIPKIGCGADKLNWLSDVLPIIQEQFDSDIFTINVCVIDANEIPSDDTFDVIEDDAEGVVDIVVSDIEFANEDSTEIIVNKLILGGFIEDSEIDIRIMDGIDTDVHTYKMVMELATGVLLNKLR